MPKQGEAQYIIGIDTGGTFTDSIVFNPQTKELFLGKTPTTPYDFSVGVMNAVADAAKSMKMTSKNLLRQCSVFKFGTTVGTNALLTRRGGRVGFITTKGFEDTTLIGRSLQKTDGLSDDEIAMMSYITKPEPLVPKARIRGVYERIDFKGNIIVPLNVDDAKSQIRYLVEDQKIEALAVSLLFSWVNPVHEQKLKELINEMYPGRDLFITYSHELMPLIREYGRANGVIMNCFVGKTMQQFLNNLNAKLRTEGFAGQFMVMQSNGGIVGWERVTPIRTLSSGPAGGVVGAQHIAATMGHGKVVSADMGGTSFDVSVMIDGQVGFEREPIIERFRIMLPMTKVESIGAGGGTMARVDSLTHRLIVGPDSASADPGPVCYDKGGVNPTVSDADLILGFLNPDYFCGGKIRINKAKAEQALKEKIADPLGMSVVQAAAGIYTIINAHMSDLVRRFIMRIGALPEEFVLYAFGGATGNHAAYFASELGIKKVIVFPIAAAFSAFGAAGADVIQTRSVSLGYKMPAPAGPLNTRLREMEGELAALMEKEGFSRKSLQYRNTFNMRYRRQVNYLSITEPAKQYKDEQDVAELGTKWRTEFDNVYGKGSAYAKAGIDLVSVDVDAIAEVPKPVLRSYPDGGEDPSAGVKGERPVFFPEITKDFVRTTIYDWDKLKPKNLVRGPAVIESPTTTVVVPSGKTATIDRFLDVELSL